MSFSRHLLRFAFLACALIFIAACQQSQPHWQLSDVHGHLPDLKFSLTNDLGKPVDAADYHGKIVMLYFGYTHCPDVCPLTLVHLHTDMQKLGKLADGVRILFVTVDPARDTPAVLHQYVTAFDPRIVGLTGSQGRIAALAKRYRAYYQPVKPGESGDYLVNHSAGIYIFDREGHARLIASNGDPQSQVVHDLRILLEQNG
ncbi:MAG: SCO family protein [Rhodanobacteraceae bacterium]